MLGNCRVTGEAVLKGEKEVAAGRLAGVLPELVKEGGVGQLAEGELGPAIDQVGIGRIFRLVEGVLATLGGQLLVAEDVEQAPADLPVGVGHHSPALQRGRQRQGVVGVDLGEDHAALLEEVGVVVAVDGDAEPLEDAVDEPDVVVLVEKVEAILNRVVSHWKSPVFDRFPSALECLLAY